MQHSGDLGVWPGPVKVLSNCAGVGAGVAKSCAKNRVAKHFNLPNAQLLYSFVNWYLSQCSTRTSKNRKEMKLVKTSTKNLKTFRHRSRRAGEARAKSPSCDFGLRVLARTRYKTELGQPQKDACINTTQGCQESS